MSLLFINPFVEDFTAYNLWAAPLGLFRLMEHFEKLGVVVEYIDLLDGKNVGYDGATPPKFRSWGRHSYSKKEIEKPEPLKFVKRKFNRFGASDERAYEILSKIKKPKKIFISTGMTYWYGSVLQTIDIVQEVFPDVEIVLGGISATLIPHFFKTEGVRVWEGAFPIDEGITGTGSKHLKDLLFFPTNIVKGCPNRCPYCASSLFDTTIKIQDIQELTENLNEWHEETKFVDVAFFDDALLLKKGAYLKEFLKKLDPARFRFHTPNGLHLKEVDEELCRYFRDYNFPQLRFGFETAFSRFDDKTNFGELAKVAQMLHKFGFEKEQIGVYLLCGLPGQTVWEVEKTIELVAEVGAKPYLSEYSPVPKTPLYKEHLKESLLDFDKEPLYQNNTVSSFRSPVFTPSVVEECNLRLRVIV
ncbi:MAG: radical SAM protein [bacterium]